jgi:predicted ATPase/DNA-binding CsgD family transcriptional regulator
LIPQDGLRRAVLEGNRVLPLQAQAAENPDMGGRISSPQFVGRVEELERLQGALADATAGKPRILLLAGEAGIGKTRLITEFTNQARDVGVLVLIGGCVQVLEQALPYAPISQALRRLARQLDRAGLEALVGGWRSELVRLVPDLPAAGLPGDRPDDVSAPTRVSELVLGVLERLAEQAPVVLVVEDLHWADRSTMDVMSFVAHNLREVAVLLIGTYRSDELHRRHPLRPVLAELGRAVGVDRLELGRFGRDDLGVLLRGILGRVPEDWLLDGILARSEGNPFFAEELLAMQLHGDQQGMPATLQDVLLARVDALSETARAVLRLAASAGQRVRHGLLAASCQLEEDALLAAVREAVGHQLLVSDPSADAYAFRHALLQEAIYADVLPGERSRLHAALARALTERPGLGIGTPAETAAEIALHWYAAHDLPRAMPAAIEAGMAAERAAAFAEAVGHFDRALDLWDQVPERPSSLTIDQVALLERAAEAAMLAGDATRAVALTREALGRVDAQAESVRAGLLYARLGRYFVMSGTEDALGVFEQAVALVPTKPPSIQRAQVLAGQAMALLGASRLQAARAPAEAALQTARLVRSRREEGQALGILGAALTPCGDLQQGMEYLQRARRIAEELSQADDLIRVWTYIPEALEGVGRLEDALAQAREGLVVLRDAGLWLPYELFFTWFAPRVLFRLGRWEEADALTHKALASQYPERQLVRLVQALIDTGRGALERAARDLEELRRKAGRRASSPSCFPLYAVLFAEATASLAIWQGAYETARAAVGQGLAQVAGCEEEAMTRTLLSLGLRVEADIAERARARRRSEEVEVAHRSGSALLAQIEQLIRTAIMRGGKPEPETVAHAALGQAEFARLQGSTEAELWAAAAASWDQLAQPYSAAYARWRQAEAVLIRRGSRAQAIAALRQARHVTERLRAMPLQREIDGLAQRARINLAERPAPKGESTPKQSPAGPFGLTRREREVLQLIAAGHTNRQIADALFISVKTASIHVSNILAKLGAANRVEATGIAHQNGLVSVLSVT